MSKTLRSAEEVARDAVTRLFTDDEGWAVAIGAAEPATDPWAAAVGALAGIIEQSRADGRAAALQEAIDVVTAERSDGPAAHNDGIARAVAVLEDLAHRGALATQQSRDLAGRIRALVMQKAGEWVDAQYANDRQAEFEMRTIRYAYQSALRGASVNAKWIAVLRRDCQFSVADELEAIVRDAGEQR